MRLLVTGGAGFIGSTYVRGLLADPDGATVTVLDSLTFCGNLSNLEPVMGDPRLTFVEADICDGAVLQDLLPGHDAIVHFAAESQVDRSIADPAPFVRTNVVGTQTLLDKAVEHRIGRFLQVSTDEVYGSIAHGSWTEESPMRPNSPYAASKAAAELLAQAYHRTYGLDVVVTRCSNNYGPYQFPDKIIPLFLACLFEGREVSLYGDGEHARDWLHVDDHCAALHLVLTKGRPGEVYNIGGGTELTNNELTGLLLEAGGAGWDRVRRVRDRKGHDRRYSMNIDKISTELGYTPRIPFSSGLADTVAWYRANGHWWRPLMERAALPIPVT
ncbi:dTDP-glucose 4,6-dehydratase [Nonomuraea sp. NPDC049158]|uniref:dTDP-glucose 4,6-dehydratase n=1 Tax=Nonomuraea sp. NPDC049158 TaxID=3155649 RepID=UPI0033D8EDBF